MPKRGEKTQGFTIVVESPMPLLREFLGPDLNGDAAIKDAKVILIKVDGRSSKNGFEITIFTRDMDTHFPGFSKISGTLPEELAEIAALNPKVDLCLDDDSGVREAISYSPGTAMEVHNFLAFCMLSHQAAIFEDIRVENHRHAEMITSDLPVALYVMLIARSDVIFQYTRIQIFELNGLTFINGFGFKGDSTIRGFLSLMAFNSRLLSPGYYPSLLFVSHDLVLRTSTPSGPVEYQVTDEQ